MAGAVLGSLAVAVALHASPAAALALVGVIPAGIIVVRLGWMGIGLILVSLLPWTVIFGAVEPRLAETFTAGTAVVVILVVAAPRDDGSAASRRLYLGMGLFYAPVVLGLARAPGSAQIIEALKYVVFPFTVLAVVNGTNRAALARLSRAALISGALAVTANLLLGFVGFNHSYYQAGDIQGLAGQHDVALLDAAVTAAALGMGTSARWMAVSAVGAIATVATGVRSTLPGLLLAVLARLSRAGARGRSLVVIGLVAAAVYVSGAWHVLVARVAYEEHTGQFASFAALGSGRGGVWSVALHGWLSSSPLNWPFGTGLRTLELIEQQATGNAVVGQSDLIQVGVELGLVGLVGLILIWWTLIVRARSVLPLLVLLPFALFNGSLEYGAPLVVTLLLTLTGDGARGEPATGAPPPG